jgi:hypothetical protein
MRLGLAWPLRTPYIDGMARPRTVPDRTVHDAVLSLWRSGGAKAVTFGAEAAASGLAASSLVQRHGSVEGMLHDARADLWARIDAATDEAAATAPAGAKGAVAYLKALGEFAGWPEALAALEDARIAALAEAWRTRVETDLALRLGNGTKGRSTAGVLFAAWQGQLIWQRAGGRAFRLKDAVKRIGG